MSNKRFRVFKTKNSPDLSSLEIKPIREYNSDLSDLGEYFSQEGMDCGLLNRDSDSFSPGSRIVYFRFPDGEDYFAVPQEAVTKEEKDEEIGKLEKIALDTVDETLRKGIGLRLDNNVDYGLDDLREDVNKYEKAYNQEIAKLTAEYRKGQFDKAKTVVETETGEHLTPVINGSDDLQKILSNCDDVIKHHYRQAEDYYSRARRRGELKSRREREEARQRGIISYIGHVIRGTKTNNINNIYNKFDLVVNIISAGVIKSDGGLEYLSTSPTQSPEDFIKSQSLREKNLKFLQAFVYAEGASSFFTKICDTGEIVLDKTAGLREELMFIPTLHSLINGVD